MTDQPLDPAAIMATHGDHVWPNTLGCLYADLDRDQPETLRCLPYRLAAALAAARRAIATLREDRQALSQRVVAAEDSLAATQAKLRAAKAVLGYREQELLALKGPCSTCRLHHAHSGPCDLRAALAGEGAADRGLCGTCLEPITATDQARRHDGEWMHVGCIGECDCPECAGEDAADQPQGSDR